MINTLVGKKKQMSQTFVGNTRVPVTVLQAGPCIVTQIKSIEADGYKAFQVGFGSKDAMKLTKPQQGHLKGAIQQNKAPSFLYEVKPTSDKVYKVGDVLTVGDVFRKGDIVAVTGTSKGKGFAGVVKRWGFGGAPRTHGYHGNGRRSGSIGQGTTPGRVRKGKKMGGRMGGDTITIKNLYVISINPEKNEMTVSGTIPGNAGNFILIHKIASGNLEDLEQVTEIKEQIEGAEEESIETTPTVVTT